ncbi:hypothetical protein NL460_29690, partial [Klebsiella pneumoniae]|nr:hypothetical protein [Klebsiella pneumoniae]
MKDRLTEAEQKAAADRGNAPSDQASVAQTISQALEKADLQIRRITVQAGPITPIPGESAEGSFSGG